MTKNKIGDFLTQLTRPLVEIRPGERMKTLLMFGYFFFVISLIYILKPVRSSLFLGDLGAERLPFVYMGEGLWLIFVVWAYVQFAKRVSKRVLYGGVLGFFISNLVLFWFLLDLKIPLITAFFYIWVASFSITMTTLFWTLANDIFNPTEAKRLFGFIISGGSLGGILGGLLTRQAVQWLRTEDLLLVAAGILFLCMLLIGALWREIPDAEKPAADVIFDSDSKEQTKDGKPRKHAFGILFGSSYLLMLAGLIIIAKMSATVVDNQFNKVVELAITGKEARTAFFGGFFSWLNAISFVMQLLAIRLCLRYLGVGFSLWVLPLGLMLLSVGTVIYPVLLTGLLFKCFDGSVNYSIQQASREVLYLPVPSADRYRVKPIIDMLGYRLAKSLSGFYILGMVGLFGLSYERVGVLVLVLLPLWFFIIWRMKKGYSKMLRQHLVDRKKYEEVVETKRATDVLSFLHDEKSFEEVKNFMDHRSSYARKLAATAYLTYDKSSRDLGIVRRLVEEIVKQEAFEKDHKASPDEEITAEDIELLDQLMKAQGQEGIGSVAEFKGYIEKYCKSILMALTAPLSEPDKNLDAKRHIVRILGAMPHQEAVDLILHTLAGARDHTFRFIMIKALSRLKADNGHLSINRFLVKSEIAREAAIYQKVQKLQVFYDQSLEKEDEANEYLQIALKAILDESQERIFDYLKLIYPQEIIQLVYERVSKFPANDSSRGHALELLANTLEPDISFIVQRTLDGRALDRVQEKEIVKILTKFSKSRDRWLYLAGFFFLSETKLEHRWPDLADYHESSELTESLIKG